MNFKTLSDYKKDEPKDDKSKKTTSYAGGQSSGLGIVNPDVEGIMKKAEKNSQSPEDFAKEQKKKDGNVCKITLYQNGFTIDDGEFNDYNTPKNKEFMKKLNEGYIPPDLRKMYPKGELSISLSDKTSEKYVPPPPPPYVEFSGSGHSLSEPSKEMKFAKKGKACENFILQPDKNKEVTTMRVRLSNGTTIAMEANTDSSLQDVYNHIATVSGISSFQLVGGYPPKPLDLRSTVEASDLSGATLIQK